MRELSKHNVSVLDLEELKKITYNSLLEDGSVTKFNKINTLDYGIVEKDGKHYLINSEGVGNASPLENERCSIFWYKTTYNEDGTEKSVECAPFMISEFYYFELMENAKIKEVIPLDKFIRSFGYRLDKNVEIWDEFLSGKLVII